MIATIWFILLLLALSIPMFMPESHQFPVAICKSRDYAIRKVRKDPLKVDELLALEPSRPKLLGLPKPRYTAR